MWRRYGQGFGYEWLENVIHMFKIQILCIAVIRNPLLNVAQLQYANK